MKILAVDPGVTTGWAVVLRDGARLLTHGQVQDDAEGLMVIRDELVRLAAEVTVVVESYIGSGPRDEHSLRTLSMMGAVRGWCVEWTGREPVWQVPQVRRAFLVDAKAALGPAATHQYRHATDAVAHALARIWHDRLR